MSEETRAGVEPGGADLVGVGSVALATATADAAPSCAGRLRGDGALAQFTRFVLVGGSSNVAYAALFLLLRGCGSLVANIAGVAVSTVLANELHRRLTFHAAERVNWMQAQWEAGGLALVGLALSSVMLALSDVWFPSAPGGAQAVLVIGVSALVGVFRFLMLRGWVFSVAR